MSDYPSSRKILQSQELVFGAAASENTVKKFGGGVNFNLEFQGRDPQWKLNGPYQSKTAGFVVDGSWIAPTDCSIYYFSMSNLTAGASGITEIDILRHATSGAGTTIFTTKPSLSYSVGNNGFMAAKFGDVPLIDENPTGSILPVFISLDLDRGDMLTMQLSTVQVGASNLTVTLNVRPR